MIRLYLIELAELLDVDMEKLTGVLALVPARRLGRLQILQSAQPQAFEHPADGGWNGAG